MKKRNILINYAVTACLLLTVFCPAALTGCGSAGNAPSLAPTANEQNDGGLGLAEAAMPADAADGFNRYDTDAGNNTAESGGSLPAVYADGNQVRKEIKNVKCSLIVKDVRAAYDDVIEIVNSLNGYEFNKSQSQREGYSTYSLTIKLPPENLTKFEERLRSSVGENAVNYYNMSSEDITSIYYDTESRLYSMKASLAQYNAMIEKARNITEMLEIRREITLLQADIDGLQGRMNMMNMLVGYATIEMTIQRESDPLADRKNEQWRFNTSSEIFNAMGNGFIATGNVVYRFIIGFFVIIVSLLPVLIPAGIIVLIVLRVRKKKKAKHNAAASVEAEPAAAENPDDERRNDNT